MTATAEQPRGSVVGRTLGDLGDAIMFLTIVPLPRRRTGPGNASRFAAWFPLIGALVGAVAAAIRAATSSTVGSGPATVLAIVGMVILTGGLHQDGLADTADGLGVRGDRERRLSVMRDPAVGAFGVMALIAWALLLFTTIAPLSDHDAAATLIAAAALARWTALVHAAALPPARTGGLGAAFTLGRVAVAVATVIAIAVTAAALEPRAAAVAVAAAALAAAAMSGLAWFAVRGRTGDTLGATVAVAEVVACAAAAAVLRG